MIEKHFILATAGHVDHGKSALIKVLTGTDPDRLPEEKARGITIDLGFAELNLIGPNGEKIHVGIVDVPGHEDFVRNMIAGVGSIDLALLVVAADDGWMPQTEEHLEILIYLGVKQIVIALAKSDLGGIDSATSKIREQLKETPFAGSPIVPTSVRTGDGLNKLKTALALEFAAIPEPRDIGKPRLFIDRAFTLHGIGTIVTGTLTDGTLRTGGKVFVSSRNISARIRSLQSHNRDVDVAKPGTRTALNLPDLVVGRDVKRGDVLTTAPSVPTRSLDVLVNRSPRLRSPVTIKSGTSAYIHHGTTRVLAKMILSETDSLATGESSVAQLRLDTPLLAFVGDRLILRDASQQHTIAGGVVFNDDSKACSSNQERALLATRAVAPTDVALAVWTEIARNGVIEPSRLLERSRFAAAEIARALQRLSDHGEIFLNDNVGAKMLLWRDFRERAAKLIDTAHQAHPECRGLELNQLRTEFSSLSPTVFETLIDDLCRTDFVLGGSTIARVSHRASLPAELKAAAEKVRSALGAKPFDPPGRKELAKDPHERQALRFLIEQNEVIEISEEIVLLRNSFHQMRTAVADFISTKGPATASQLREKLGSSRRVIIPFLEYLDRTGVTRRVGDQRVLAKQTAVVKLDDAETARRS